MPQLDFSTYLGQFLWLFFSFSILYLLIQFVFFPRIEYIIESRIDLVKKNIAVAEHAIAQAKKIKADIAAKLQKTNEQAQQMSVKAEKDIKMLLKTKEVENESITAKTLKEEATKLSILCETEIKQHAPAIVAELKEDILRVLMKNFSSEKRK